MLGVSERLELPRLFGGPGGLARFFTPKPGKNRRQKLRLRQNGFGSQTRCFARLLEGSKVYLRSEILLSGIGEQVATNPLFMISAQGAFPPVWRQEFLGA